MDKDTIIKIEKDKDYNFSVDGNFKISFINDDCYITLEKEGMWLLDKKDKDTK